MSPPVLEDSYQRFSHGYAQNFTQDSDRCYGSQVHRGYIQSAPIPGELGSATDWISCGQLVIQGELGSATDRFSCSLDCSGP